MILEYYITCYRGRRRRPASGLATRLGHGAWRPGLPAAAAAAAGVEPAGPRADSGRLGEAAVAAAAPGCCCCGGGQQGSQAPGPNRVASPLAAGCGPVRHAPEAAQLRRRPW